MISSIRIALSYFYQLIFYFYKLLTWIYNWIYRLPFAETLTLNLSVVVFLTIVAFFLFSILSTLLAGLNNFEVLDSYHNLYLVI